ncbi:hypothetical protein DO021_07395 [Desulfobacter hydrogenophilus]|uniref:HAD family hydrolase n=1 Tax=Desulfobacter hydrogenophilus TaxID=2291 RepID=A0A328FFM7_9BACT|nr:hypothetical protein [Desulfobacter hydrogenophilus]NDY71876.1 hypothetical protein [Desulfobacter hydrogenophilus]QBH11989.1 hypothetical protein EYB58_03030 [Desulfobacter hydrogenophilus]RAM02650.1 hypothetical protein DO021_07395 [Desulfobacter hydrogenophilus]
MLKYQQVGIEQSKFTALLGQAITKPLITFDLDDTLICWQPEIPTEYLTLPWHHKWLNIEPLRYGTVHLFKQLRNYGWQIGIYTTSHRKPKYIKRLFNLHGLKLDLVINQDRHEKIIKNLLVKRKPSKLPNRVNAMLHIDNSEGVFIEGKRFHFRVLIVDPLDDNWTEKILAESISVARMLEQGTYRT